MAITVPEPVVRGVHLRTVERHPADGWVHARPYPMRKAARIAFRAIVSHMVPPAPAPRTPELLDQVDRQARIHLSYMTPILAFGLAIAVVLLDWSPLLVFRGKKRLRAMSTEDGAAWLNRLGETRFPLLPTVIMGLRATIMGAYWDQDEAQAAIHYAPRAHLNERIALREELMAASAASLPRRGPSLRTVPSSAGIPASSIAPAESGARSMKVARPGAPLSPSSADDENADEIDFEDIRHGASA